MATVISKNGLVVVDARPPYDNRVISVASKPDGSIVVFGNGQQLSGSNKDAYVIQLSKEIILDTNYADNGIRFIDPSYIGWSSGVLDAVRWGDEWLTESYMKPDGTVISVGYYIPVGNPEYRLFVSQVNETGNIDNAFGTEGVFTMAIGGANVYGWEVLKADSTGILILGDATSRYAGWDVSGNTFLLSLNSDGQLNRGVFLDGIRTFNIGGGRFQSGVVQPDGKIVIAGVEAPIGNYLQSRIIVARLNSDGSLDSGFSNDGFDIKGIGENASVRDVILQSDGKILVVGSSHSSGSSSDFLLVRYNTNGTLDQSFSGDGIVTTDFFGGADSASAVAIQGDGKIVVAGYTTYADQNIYPDPNAAFFANTDFALARYTTDGRLDSTFSTDGKVTTDFGSHSDSANAIHIQSDGKIVLSGETYIWNADSDTAGNHYAGALARYQQDGSLDTQFGRPVDSIAPSLLSINPADESTNVAVNSDLLFSFSESITRGIGNIVLKSSTDAVIATYDAATSSNIAISGSTLTINPTTDLAYDTSYKVEFATGSVKDLAGNIYAGTTSYNFTTKSSPYIQGTLGNDTLVGGSGKPIDGLAGIDTVTYSGNRVPVVNNANGTWAVGPDTLTNIERLQFADKRVALDITDNALETLQFIGVIAPSLQSNLNVRGKILSLFDQGKSMQEMSQLALDIGLITSDNTALAKQVFKNVFNTTADPDQGLTNTLINFIEQNGDAKFLATVAGLNINVDLVGVQQHGMEYML